MKKVIIIGGFNGIRVDSGAALPNVIDITPIFKNEEMRISQYNNVVKISNTNSLPHGSVKFTELKKEK
jgi:hypothetical protein